MPAPRLPRPGELAFAALLFAALAALSWLRWASFQGDLSREWTVPMRLAAGERLWRDVGYYYGPLAPYAVAGAFRAFGSTVATYAGFGLLAAAATLAALVLAGRRFLPPFAGAGVLLAGSGRVALAGLAGALALLAKPEAAPALLGAAVLAGSWRAGLRLLAISGLVAGTVYAVATAGIPLADLVSYGPLRHLAMPPEFRELYLRVSGLHPALLPRGAGGLLAGAALLSGWALLATGLVSRRAPLAAGGGALLGGGLLAGALALREPVVTTGVRGLPLLLLSLIHI